MNRRRWVEALLVSSMILVSPVFCLSDGLDRGDSGDMALAHHSAEDGASNPGFVEYVEYANHINNSYTGGEDVYASSSLGCWPGVYQPGAGQWGYWFDLEGIGVSTDGIIHAAAVEIDGTSCMETLVVDVIDNSRYLWSDPEPTEGTDLDTIYTFIVDLAMSAITGVGASLTWTLASEPISCFGSDGTDDSVTRDNYAWRLWQWSPDEPEVSQYSKFLILVDPEETVSFTVEYMLFGYGYEYLSGGCYEVEITAPPATETEGTDVDIGGASGVAAVSMADIGESSEYYSLLSLADEYDISDDMLYIDASPQIAITVSDPTAALCPCIEDAHGLLDACGAQIARSVKIVNAFSAGEVTARDAEVVERHQALIDSLGAVVDSLAAGGSDFNQLYAEYVAATDGAVTPDAEIELRVQ